MRREWRIPGERMKAGREHRVPLSDAAVEVLDLAREVDDGSGLVFPSRKGRELSGTVFAKIDASARNRRDCSRVPVIVPGLVRRDRDSRARSRKPLLLTWSAGPKAAYFRSDLFDRRRALMAEWGAFVAG